jgi:16S rRNA (guanine527-N7)-methyltransferase
MAHPVDVRLRELAAQWQLPPAAPEQLRTVLRCVADEPTSITTVRDPATAVDVHVADSLSVLAAEPVRHATQIADLGAGGGFPGLVLAVALPDATVSLVESVGKKCDFLRRAAAAAGLGNVVVVNARAESWSEGLGAMDVVTARALAPLNVLVEYAAPLLRDGGALVAMKAGRDPSEEGDGSSAAEVLGLEPRDPVPVAPFDGSGPRHLHLYLKVRPTPDRFPRREGMARKRPIEAST